MNKERGITLMVLIITIIVMLILVTVTVDIALEGGIFVKAKEAAFKTDVRQIQESLESEKTIVIAKNNGRIPATYSIGRNDLDNLSSETIAKYSEKLAINEDGEIVYIEGKVNEQEIEWLADLGIVQTNSNS